MVDRARCSIEAVQSRVGWGKSCGGRVGREGEVDNKHVLPITTERFVHRERVLKGLLGEGTRSHCGFEGEKPPSFTECESNKPLSQ